MSNTEDPIIATFYVPAPVIKDCITTVAIKWIPVSEPPDDEMTVLLFSPQASEPVWPGYLDGDQWRYADGMVAEPTYWADIPEGPKV